MVTINASYDIKQYDYAMQHKYRSKSIEIFFLKDLFWAIILCYLSYIIYYDYNDYFKEKEIYY